MDEYYLDGLTMMQVISSWEQVLDQHQKHYMVVPIAEQILTELLSKEKQSLVVYVVNRLLYHRYRDS